MAQTATVPNVKPACSEFIPIEPRLKAMLMLFRRALLMAAAGIDEYLQIK